jgi:3-oxoacyl-[acyl-carrier-protein] synthase-3
MRYEDIYIAGTGAYHPRAVPVDEAIEDGRYTRDAQRHTGQQRVTIAETAAEAAPEMAVRAGRSALAHSGLPADQFSLLLHGVATHNGLAGWNAASYVQQHVLDGNGFAFEIHQLSNSAVGSLELACSYLAAGPDRTAAMITAADRFGPAAWDRFRSAPPIFVFADAASAVVLAKGTGFARVLSVASVADAELEGMQRGALPFMENPQDGYPISFFDRILEFSETHGLGVDDVVKRMSELMHEAGARAYAEAGISPADVKFAITPALGREALYEQCVIPLGIDIDRSTWHYARQIGHAGCTDQFAALDNLVATERLNPGDRILIAGLGGGYNCTVAALEIVDKPTPGLP